MTSVANDLNSVDSNSVDGATPVRSIEKYTDCLANGNVDVVVNGDTSNYSSPFAAAEIPKDLKNRVKLYILCEQTQWEDRGTGHVACIPPTDLDDCNYMVVRLEQSGKNILESRILLDTIYQRQQDTLIVWSESDTYDLAISFQDRSGCEEIWDKICRIQGRDPDYNPDHNPEFASAYEEADENIPSDVMCQAYSDRLVTGALSLPPCDLANLNKLENFLSKSLSIPPLREKLATDIENQGYVGKLCELFHVCEDLSDLEGLKLLFSIARSLFMLNRNSVIEILLSHQYFKDIVGMLEYDPYHRGFRRHRQFLFEKAKFREVLPISNEELKMKIHKTFRVQYIQDMCLPVPSLFEENLLSVLSSYVFFHRVEIVHMLLEDKALMSELFKHLRDNTITVERRKDLTVFLREFLAFSSSLQNDGPRGREAFYKNLMQYDMLAIIEPGISSQSPYVCATTIEMFTMIIEFNPQSVREYIISNGKCSNDSTATASNLFMDKLIKVMLCDRDPELSSGFAVAQILRTLLDPDTMINVPNSKSERHEFLTFFYRRSMNTLCHEIFENTEDSVIKRDDYYMANKQALVIDLLCFCFEHHTVHMRNYCINNKLLNKILVLVRSKHHFLALTALRLFRRVIQLKDEYFYRYIVRDDVMRIIVECFNDNGNRYNLLNSAMLELFEHIQVEGLKLLILYIGEKFMDCFEDVTYVKTFSGLKQKCDMFNEGEIQKSEDSAQSSVDSNLSTQWKKEHQADADEQWFDEDENENISPATAEAWDTIQTENASPNSLFTTDVESFPTNATLLPLNEIIPTRKLSYEPNFPSVLKVKDDDSDRVFSGSPCNLKARVQSRITIKVNDRRIMDKPSESPPCDPSVSSTEPIGDASSSNATLIDSSEVQVTATKALVDYDESDSDEDESESTSKSDAIPSCSADNSVSESACSLSVSIAQSTTSSDQDSVSSTSGDIEILGDLGSPCSNSNQIVAIVNSDRKRAAPTKMEEESLTEKLKCTLADISPKRFRLDTNETHIQ